MTFILDSEEQITELLSAPVAIVHKWSPICGVSTSVQRVVDKIEAAHPDIPIYRVDVIGQRPLSNRLARDLDVTHESPQIILLREGAVVYHESHWAISSGALTESVASSEQG